MNRTLSPRTRRSFLQEGVLASLAMIASLGALPISDVSAGKNDGRKAQSIAKRVKIYQRSCEAGGGTAAPPTVNRGGTTVTCKDSEAGSWSCTVHSKGSRCHATMTEPTGPTQPLQPDAPFATPGDVPVVPLQPDGGGVTITAYDGDQHDEGKHHSKRKHHRRSERSR